MEDPSFLFHRFIVEKARDTAVYDQSVAHEANSGLMARLRHALAA